MGIENPRQLETHPLRGALFETWVVSEIAKAYLHRGRRPRMSFYRDRSQLEIDLILEKGADLTLVEIKAARTPSSQYFAAFQKFSDALAGQPARVTERVVVYGGDETQDRSQGRLLSWSDLGAWDHAS